MRKSKIKEESLQIALSKYIKLAYPDVIFTAEGSGLKLGKGQAVKAAKQRSERGLPDLWVDEPRGKYHGLRLELKKLDKSPYRKDGKGFKKDARTDGRGRKYDHIQEQAAIIARLRKKGYCADFAVGFDEAKCKIDWYMSLPENYRQ